ncbi:MAG TPA: hypothetical protein VJ754_08405 [Anaerolineae bacterium]|nr:hypothetical protein [Anaerolineae bacterium]
MRRTVFLAVATALILLPGIVHAQSITVDAVILVDTSSTMRDELDSLCASLPDTLASHEASGLRVRTRVIGIYDEYQCADSTVRQLIANSAVADDEDWGVAIAELIGGYTWDHSAHRLIIVVSDAGPVSGKLVYDPGLDRDAVTRAIQLAATNKVILSSLLGSPDPDVSAADRARLAGLARDMAAATGGRVFISQMAADVPAAISQLISAAAQTTAGLTAIAVAIPTPGKVSLDSGVLLTNLVLSGLAAVLFGLTTLLSVEAFGGAQTRGAPSNRVTGAIGRATGRIDRAFDVIATPSAWPVSSAPLRRAATAVLLTALLAVTALIASFVDPDFQANTPRGVATTVTLLVAFTVVTLATASGGKLLARSLPVTSGLRMRPGALLIVLLSVLLSRSLNFLPGFLIGLPAGLAVIAAENDPGRDLRIGRASILAAIFVAALAWLLAWPVESLLSGMADSLNSDVASLALTVVGGIQSALLAIFLVAIEYALIELLPIGPLTGRAWFAQRRLVWGVVFGVVIFAALHTLFNPADTGFEALRNPGLLPLGAILAVYSGVTLLVWLLTNESRIRAQQGVNRRSALVAGALIVAWLGGLACVALTAVASAISSTTVLVVAGIAVVVGVGVWLVNRFRAGRASPPSSRA